VLPGANRAVTHLVFSDGLASVSVFVEPEPRRALRPPGAAAEPATMTNVGPSSALQTEVNGHRVTTIGEVPPATVRAITDSLREGFASPGRPAVGKRH
jgi:sigma-E factor negative regulatory protein RseB